MWLTLTAFYVDESPLRIIYLKIAARTLANESLNDKFSYR